MSTSISSGAFATFQANNSHLYSRSNRAFAIHQNNGFIKTRSPKLKIKKLTQAQKQQIRQKLKSYIASEKRGVLVTSAITLAVTSGLAIIAYQLLSF